MMEAQLGKLDSRRVDDWASLNESVTMTQDESALPGPLVSKLGNPGMYTGYGCIK
jgi:hypothetical protein